MTEPANKKHESEQTVVTPLDLIRAVENRFGPITWDLAATAENTKAPRFFTPEQDALSQDWTKLSGILWCNPPFAELALWTRKSALSVGPGRVILLLSPLGVGEWATAFVEPFAYRLALAGRVRFVGHKHVFPKDLMLSVYGWGCGFGTWRWKRWVNGQPPLPVLPEVKNGRVVHEQ